MKKEKMNFKVYLRSRTLFVLVFTSFLQFNWSSTNTVVFNRTKTGVVFNPPYQSSTDWSLYSLEDVQTMLQVISTKFSRITTYGRMTNQGVNTSHALSAKAAAMLNKNRSLTNPIRLYVGVNIPDDPTEVDLEMKLARESIENANNIAKGTVEGIVFTYNYSNEDVALATSVAQEMFKVTNNNTGWKGKLKVGSRQDCDKIGTSNNNDLNTIQEAIIGESDFSICEVYPSMNSYHPNIDKLTELYKQKLNIIRFGIEVMVQMGIGAKAENVTEVAAMQKFWSDADKLAGKVWLDETFDNPWKNSSSQAAHMGWWKLRNIAVFNSTEAYVEKVQILPRTIPNTVTTTISTISVQATTLHSNTGTKMRQIDAVILCFGATLIQLLFVA